MKRTIEELKALFETGDKPDQQAFIDLIDTLCESVNAVLINPTITEYTETTNKVIEPNNSFTVDLTLGTRHIFTLNNNSSINLPEAIIGKSYMVELIYLGNYTPTFVSQSNIAWSGGTPPTATATANKRDKYFFECSIAGTIDGSDGGRNYNVY